MRNKTEHTENQVLRYVYHETSESQSDEIRQMIFAEREMEEMFYELLSTKEDLDQKMLTPRQSVIDNILAFSQNSQQQKETIL